MRVSHRESFDLAQSIFPSGLPLGSFQSNTPEQQLFGALAVQNDRSSLSHAGFRLNLLRRNGVTGEGLLKTLANLFHQHNMRAWMDRQGSSSSRPIPKIICSEALGLS